MKIKPAEKTIRAISMLGFLAKQVTDIVQLAESMNLPSELRASLEKAYHLAVDIDPYVNQYTTPESEALATLAQKTYAENWEQHFSDGKTVTQLDMIMLTGHIDKC